MEKQKQRIVVLAESEILDADTDAEQVRREIESSLERHPFVCFDVLEVELQDAD